MATSAFQPHLTLFFGLTQRTLLFTLSCNRFADLRTANPWSLTSMHKVKAQHRRAREYPEEEFNPWRRRERPEENPRMNRTPAIGVYDDDGSPLREAKKRDLPRFLRRLFDHFDKEPKPHTTLKRAVPLASFFEDRRFTAMSQLRATFLNSWFNFIGIVLVPAGFAVRYTKGPSLATFLVNSLPSYLSPSSLNSRSQS